MTHRIGGLPKIENVPYDEDLIYDNASKLLFINTVTTSN